MGGLIKRDFIKTAGDGYPLSMRLISAVVPTMAVLISSGTGSPKGFDDRLATWLAERGAAMTVASAKAWRHCGKTG